MQSAATVLAPRAPETSAPAVRCWRAFADGVDTEPDAFVLDAPGVEAIAAVCAGVILPAGGEERANTLLAAGAVCVFVGAAALRDSMLIERLAAAHGSERVGVFAPLRRQAVSWSFETVSNADFKTVAPSFCEPAWEVLDAAGAGTGALARWWLGAMRQLGASRCLVCVDIRDDTDLNLCAGLVEDLGDALWIAPLQDSKPPLADWVEFGQCCQIVLPETVYRERATLLRASGETA